MSQIEAHATPALLLLIYKNNLKRIHSAHNMELSETNQNKILQLVPTLQNSLNICTALTDDTMVYAFPCTNIIIVYKLTTYTENFFSILIKHIATCSLPKVFACGNYSECTDDNCASEITALGNSITMPCYTLISINIQPISAYFNKVNLFQFSGDEICDHLALMLANLNPALSLTIKKNNTTIFYVIFHKQHHNSNLIVQPFIRLLDSLLQLPQTFIKILETRTIKHSITENQ